MKLRLFIIAILAILVASCTREPLPELEENGNNIISISATIAPETRVSYTDGILAWQTDDQLLLAGYDDNNAYKGASTFTWSGTGDVFSGPAVSGATKYRAYYPASLELDANGNMLPVSCSCNYWQFSEFWHQTQDGSGTTGHLRNKLILIDDEPKSPIGALFQLVAKNSVIKFDLSGIPTEIGTLEKLVWTVEYAAGGYSKYACLNITNVSGSTMTAYLSFDPTITKIIPNGNMNITLIGDQASYEWNVQSTNGKNYAAGKRYTATVSGPWVPAKIEFKYTVTTGNNDDHYVYQNSGAVPSISPANLTIDWGAPGSSPTYIAKGTTLSSNVIASYRYANKGDYTVTITTDEVDPSKIQIPQIRFSVGNTGVPELTSVITPFPNMGVTNFSHWFHECSALTSLPAGLFCKNPGITNFSFCFYKCGKLVLNPDLFPNPVTNPNLFVGREMNFESCFDQIGTHASTQGVAPRLWDFTQNPAWNVLNCFKNANVSNSGDIPTNWK